MMTNETLEPKIPRGSPSSAALSLIVLMAVAGGGCSDSAAEAISQKAAAQERCCNKSCHGDSGAPDDADAAQPDADGGCSCTPNGTQGGQSLACFCASDPCPTYDEAIKLCPPSPFPEDNRVDTYADCNLVVIEYSGGFDYGSYVYDATTHALLGGLYGTDYDAYVCGSTRVFSVRAGTFPPPTCSVSQSALRCVDGGGAAASR